MSLNDQESNDDDLAIDIEDIRNSLDPHNRGRNHGKVSQILSGWMPKQKTGNNQVHSSVHCTGEMQDGDGILSHWGEENSSVPPENKLFNLTQLKSGRSREGYDHNDEPEKDEGLHDKDKKDEKVKEWKKILKLVGKGEKGHVQRKIDEFLTSQKTENLE